MNKKLLLIIIVLFISMNCFSQDLTYVSEKNKNDTIRVHLDCSDVSCMTKNIIRCDFFGMKLINNGGSFFDIGFSGKHFFNDQIQLDYLYHYALADISDVKDANIPHSFFMEAIGTYVISSSEGETHKRISLYEGGEKDEFNRFVSLYTVIKVPVKLRHVLAARFGLDYFASKQASGDAGFDAYPGFRYEGCKELAIALGINYQRQTAVELKSKQEGNFYGTKVSSYYADLLIAPGMTVYGTDSTGFVNKPISSYPNASFSHIGFRLGMSFFSSGGKRDYSESDYPKVLFSKGTTFEIGGFPFTKEFYMALKFPLGIAF
jgi:hypothetical protein